MEKLKQDFLLSLRTMRRNPTFAAVAIVVLALGLGTIFAVYTIVEAVLLRQLPYKEPDRLVKVWETFPPGRSWVSPANFRDWVAWNDQEKLFAGLAAFSLEDVAVIGDGEPRLVRGASVSPELITLLGGKPLLGRTFAANEADVAGGRVVLIGESYWRRELGGDSGVVGKVMTVAGAPHTVVGILPSWFDFPGRVELWRPLVLVPEQWSMRGGHFLEVVARLGSGVSAQQATSAMQVLTARLAKQYPETNTGGGAELVPLHEEMVGDIRPALLVLSGAVGFVLLAVCANLVCLLLARITERQRETAIRLTLGASRSRLVRQLCTEATVLTVVGGVIGLLLAHWILRLFMGYKPAELNQIQDISLHVGILGFGLALSLAAGLLSGLVPALLAARQGPDATVMREGERTSSSKSSRRLQRLFVIGQITLALVLSVGAGLMSRSFGQLQKVSPGFETSGVVALTVTLPESVYAEPAQQAEVFRRIVERVQELPAVESAAVVSTLPLSGQSLGFELSIEGRPAAAPGESLSAGYDVVSPDYFKVMRIPLRQGRIFTERDNSRASAVALINETLARRHWPGKDPVGQRITIGDRGPNPREIIGVVADVRHNGLDAEPRGEMYVPQAQAAWSVMTLVVHSGEAPGPLMEKVRHAVWSVDRSLPVSQEAALEKVVSNSVSQRRFNALLLGLFAVLAVVLAVLGLYGLLAQAVADRRREIGIRMALGANSGDIKRMVLGQGFRLVLLGLAVGIPVALLLSRVLVGLLFQVSNTDPWTFVGVSFAMATISLIAGFIPASRAVRVDPLVSMRGE